MLRAPSARRLRCGATLLVTLTCGLLLTACQPGEDPVLARAQQVYEQTMQADPQYAKYGLSIAAGTSSPFARETLVRYLGNDYYPTALEAARALRDDPPPQARDALQAVFERKGGVLKIETALGLARLGDEQAAAWLRSQLEGGGGLLNLAIVEFFAERDEKDLLLPLLRKRMESDDPGTRNEAYAFLGAVAKPWSTAQLTRGLDQEFGAERQQAIAALGRSGDPTVASKIQRFVNTKGLVFVSLEALGALGNPDTIGAVRKMAGHEEALVRVYAGIALWRLGQGAEAREALEPLVEDADVTVRNNLAEQLASVAADEAIHLLVRLAQDEDRGVRVAAVRSLAHRDGPEVRAALIAAAADRSYDVGTLALNGLARTGTAEAEATIVPLMESKNPYTAMAAAHALLAIRGRETVAQG